MELWQIIVLTAIVIISGVPRFLMLITSYPKLLKNTRTRILIYKIVYAPIPRNDSQRPAVYAWGDTQIKELILDKEYFNLDDARVLTHNLYREHAPDAPLPQVVTDPTESPKYRLEGTKQIIYLEPESHILRVIHEAAHSLQAYYNTRKREPHGIRFVSIWIKFIAEHGINDVDTLIQSVNEYGIKTFSAEKIKKWSVKQLAKTQT